MWVGAGDYYGSSSSYLDYVPYPDSMSSGGMGFVTDNMGAWASNVPDGAVLLDAGSSSYYHSYSYESSGSSWMMEGGAYPVSGSWSHTTTTTSSNPWGEMTEIIMANTTTSATGGDMTITTGDHGEPVIVLPPPILDSDDVMSTHHDHHDYDDYHELVDPYGENPAPSCDTETHECECE